MEAPQKDTTMSGGNNDGGKDIDEPDDSSATGMKRVLGPEQPEYSELTEPSEPKKRKVAASQQQQQQKRLQSDILLAFFRVFLVEEKDGEVEKDAIWNLYSRKVSSENRLARNAAFRQFWTFFKEKNITAKQQHYRDTLKGIRLRRGEPLPAELERDVVLLRETGTKEPILEFNDQDLTDPTPPPPPPPPPPPAAAAAAKTSPTISATTTSALDRLGASKYLGDGSNSNIIAAVDALEAHAKLLAQALAELKAKVIKQDSA